MLAGLAPANAAAGGKAKHVVLIIWDGMRPDFATPELAPNLTRLIREGVWFQRHHPVFLSATEVNGTALATGAYPRHSSLIANTDYRPEINPLKPINTEVLEVVRKGDACSGGHYFQVPTMAEILQRRGLPTAVAGTKAVALLQDRAARQAATRGVTLFEGRTEPPALAATLTNLLGSFPATGTNKVERDRWTTRALTGPFWAAGVPALSVLWLAEPDYSQHNSSPGSRASKTAISGSDAALGLVLDALQTKGAAADTDVLVVSDHGFATVGGKLDVAGQLQTQGLRATNLFVTVPEPGDVMVVGNGGATLIYVVGRDRKIVRSIVETMQVAEGAGAIFTREPAPGTFPLSAVLVNKASGPDVIVAGVWSRAPNAKGAPGMVTVEGIPPSTPPTPGATQTGSHAGTSPYELHNTLVAAGPDFRRGYVDELPSGNVDVAPTILWLLGVKPPGTMDGRVLREAMVDAPARVSRPKTRLFWAECNQGGRTRRQYLQRSEVDGVIYLDEAGVETSPPTVK